MLSSWIATVASQVREMCKQREEEAGYSIVFLGANIDAYKEAKRDQEKKG